jgi:alanyl-tRNA synthetase
VSATRLLFRDDPDLLEFEAEVVEQREVGGRSAVVLDRTAFYATSGGQPHDTGTLDGVPVVDVVLEGETVLHVIAGSLDAPRVLGRVDAPRRRDHLQQHHGQHLLSRAFVEVASAETVAFHLGEESCTVDLDRFVGEEGIARAEQRANDVVWAGRPVGSRVMTRAECAAAGIEVPPEASGDAIRIVDAGGWDVQPCSGTHPRSTSAVGLVLVVGQERLKSGTRVRFVCGDRALRQAGRWRSLLARTAAALEGAVDDVPAGVERLLAGRDALEREARGLRELARGVEAKALAAAAEAGVLVRRLDGRAPAELKALALEIVAAAPVLVLLGSVHEGRAHLVFARGTGVPHDAAALLKLALAPLGGRGGGKPDVAQGGGPEVAGLDAALAAAVAAIH